MEAESEVGFAAVPLPKEVSGQLGDNSLIHCDRSIREESFRESKGRGHAAEEKTGLRELSPRLPEKAPMLSLLR
jgi:hypothetical protein